MAKAHPGVMLDVSFNGADMFVGKPKALLNGAKREPVRRT
jgi:hypothetical protein